MLGCDLFIVGIVYGLRVDFSNFLGGCFVSGLSVGYFRFFEEYSYRDLDVGGRVGGLLGLGRGYF